MVVCCSNVILYCHTTRYSSTNSIDAVVDGTKRTVPHAHLRHVMETVRRKTSMVVHQMMMSRHSCSCTAHENNITTTATYELTEEDERMVERMKDWVSVYKKAIVPKSVHDGKELSLWMKRMRQRRDVLGMEDIVKLEEAGMVWEWNTVEAKWFANFHLAREFLEMHGDDERGAFVDPDQEGRPFYHEERSDWVEASRWLCRQRELYRKQKLNLMQVYLLKRVLGVRLVRQDSKKRRNVHEKIREVDREFLLSNNSDTSE
jgi:hypothetical protein